MRTQRRPRRPEKAGVDGERIVLVGGGARSRRRVRDRARRLRPSGPGPEPAEYVAIGAARQAAWSLSGDAVPPVVAPVTTRSFEADSDQEVYERYAAAVRNLHADESVS